MSAEPTEHPVPDDRPDAGARAGSRQSLPDPALRPPCGARRAVPARIHAQRGLLAGAGQPDDRAAPTLPRRAGGHPLRGRRPVQSPHRTSALGAAAAGGRLPHRLLRQVARGAQQRPAPIRLGGGRRLREPAVPGAAADSGRRRQRSGLLQPAQDRRPSSGVCPDAALRCHRRPPGAAWSRGNHRARPRLPPRSNRRQRSVVLLRERDRAARPVRHRRGRLRPLRRGRHPAAAQRAPRPGASAGHLSQGGQDVARHDRPPAARGRRLLLRVDHRDRRPVRDSHRLGRRRRPARRHDRRADQRPRRAARLARAVLQERRRVRRGLPDPAGDLRPRSRRGNREPRRGSACTTWRRPCWSWPGWSWPGWRPSAHRTRDRSGRSSPTSATPANTRAGSPSTTAAATG